MTTSVLFSFSLRLVLFFRLILLEYSWQEPNGLGPVIVWLNYSNDVHVFVVRKANAMCAHTVPEPDKTSTPYEPSLKRKDAKARRSAAKV